MRTRLATNDDAEAIRVIYNAEVVGSTVTFDMVPRSPSDQLAWLVEHRGAHPAIVAVEENDVGENDGGEDAGQSGDSGDAVGGDAVGGEVGGGGVGGGRVVGGRVVGDDVVSGRVVGDDVVSGRVVGSGVVGGVLGFASVSPYRNRPAYSTTVEDSVYVRPDCRGQGVGRLLLSDLVELTAAHGFHSVMARIVGGHEASIALHRSCGFQLVGVEREVGRKFGRWLDVVVMQRLL